jgi:peptide-methionine (S)-S-oxide reductase
MKRLFLVLLCLAAATAAVLFRSAEGGAAQPAAASKLASAVFAGGCFWCTESDFDHMPGVVSTTSGYSGGRVAKPTYEQVSAGGTGHLEAVKVVYDPSKTSYEALVAGFFKTVDAVDSGGQFCDRGSQYRSAIFVATPQQRQIAERVKARAAAYLKQPVATSILPAAPFYAAEAYHQDYYRRHGTQYRYYRWRCGRDARLKELWKRRG